MVQSRAEHGFRRSTVCERMARPAQGTLEMWRNNNKPPAGTPDWQMDDALFRRLVEDVPDYAIFLLDPDGIVRTWNEGAERTKGYTASEIIGRHFSTFYPADQVASGWPDHELRSATQTGRFEDEGWRVR